MGFVREFSSRTVGINSYSELNQVTLLLMNGGRFRRWVKGVKFEKLRPWIQTQMPPLDVLMVWHTYMLNPAYVCPHTRPSLSGTNP